MGVEEEQEGEGRTRYVLGTSPFRSSRLASPQMYRGSLTLNSQIGKESLLISSIEKQLAARKVDLYIPSPGSNLCCALRALDSLPTLAFLAKDRLYIPCISNMLPR